MLRKTIGVILLLVPFAMIFAAVVYLHGVVDALIMFAIIAVVLGCIVGGIKFLAEE